MGQAGVINRPGGEGQLEGAVGILIGDIEELRACLLMLKQHQIRADHLKRPDFLDFKAFDYIADGGQADGFVSVGRSRFRNRGQDADKQSQRKQQGQQFFHFFPSVIVCILPRDAEQSEERERSCCAENKRFIVRIPAQNTGMDPAGNEPSSIQKL